MPLKCYKTCSCIKPFFENGICEGITSQAHCEFSINRLIVGSGEGNVCILDMQKECKLTSLSKSHATCITDITFLLRDSNLFVTSSRDGTLKMHDPRLSLTSEGVLTFRVTSQNDQVDLWSVTQGGPNGNYLACGFEDTIPVYDLRAGARQKYDSHKSSFSDRLLTLNESHSDVVNVVKFHPLYTNLLVSGADDNLIVMHDVSSFTSVTPYQTENILEKDARNQVIVRTLNNEAPPRLFSFVGPGLSTLSAISTIETLTLWNFSSLCVTLNNRQHDLNENEREYLPLKLGHIPPSIEHNPNQFPSEPSVAFYIVNVHYDEASRCLWSVAGSFTGQLMMYQVSDTCYVPFATFDWSRVTHSDVVRCVSIIPENSLSSFIITSGNDGKVLIWRAQ